MMRILCFMAVALMSGALTAQDQCINGACHSVVEPVPMAVAASPETQNYTGTMAGGCKSRQRIGNRVFIQVGLITILQGQQGTQGSRESATLGKQPKEKKSGPLRKLLGRRR